MTFKEWLQKHDDVTKAIAAKKLGCSIYAIRKWISGERTPRPKMQAKIKSLTANEVNGDDWVPTR